MFVPSMTKMCAFSPNTSRGFDKGVNYKSFQKRTLQGYQVWLISGENWEAGDRQFTVYPCQVSPNCPSVELMPKTGLNIKVMTAIVDKIYLSEQI